MRKLPFASEVVLDSTPVTGFLTVILALGTTAPDGSAMVPLTTAPPRPCGGGAAANTGALNRKARVRMRSILARELILPPIGTAKGNLAERRWESDLRRRTGLSCRMNRL